MLVECGGGGGMWWWWWWNVVVAECGGGGGGGGMWWWWWWRNVVVVVVAECGGGGGGGGEENKIKISTKYILFTIIFNTCLTTKLYNKFMYNYIHLKKKTLKFMYNFLQFYLNNILTYWHQDSLHSCHTALGFAHNPKIDACVQTQNWGHGGRVVTLSPPTSAAGVRSPSWP